MTKCKQCPNPILITKPKDSIGLCEACEDSLIDSVITAKPWSEATENLVYSEKQVMYEGREGVGRGHSSGFGAKKAYARREERSLSPRTKDKERLNELN